MHTNHVRSIPKYMPLRYSVLSVLKTKHHHSKVWGDGQSKGSDLHLHLHCYKTTPLGTW